MPGHYINKFTFLLSISETKLRHQKRLQHEILQFQFENIENTYVEMATLNLYVRGEQWLKQNEPNLLSNSNYNDNLTLTVHRITRNTNLNVNTNKIYHHIINNYYSTIPKDKGSYIKIDVTEMVADWFRNPQNNHGVAIKSYGQIGPKLIIVDSNHSDYVSISIRIVFILITK